MGRIIRKSIGTRITLCLIALIVSIFFIGAGANKVTEERSDRKVTRKAEIERWQGILAEMSEDMPEVHRKKWLQIAQKDPEYLLKMTSYYSR